MTAGRSRLIASSLKHFFLVMLAIFVYYPFIFLLFTSFKDIPQFYHEFWLPAFPLHPENYAQAWRLIHRYTLNSVVITSTSVTGVLIVSSLSAFAFARYRFFAKEILFYMIIGLLMVPQVLTLVPSFVWMKRLGLLDTWGALIFPYIAGGQILAIFILRTFFASTPEALYESMRLDGASKLQEYYYLAIPLSRSILGVIAIINMLNTWNDYIWPLVVISTDRLRTLTVGLVYFQGQYATQYGPQMAGYIIGSIPLLIVFFLTMRSFISGLATGALKM